MKLPMENMKFLNYIRANQMQVMKKKVMENTHGMMGLFIKYYFNNRASIKIT